MESTMISDADRKFLVQITPMMMEKPILQGNLLSGLKTIGLITALQEGTIKGQSGGEHPKIEKLLQFLQHGRKDTIKLLLDALDTYEPVVGTEVRKLYQQQGLPIPHVPVKGQDEGDGRGASGPTAPAPIAVSAKPMKPFRVPGCKKAFYKTNEKGAYEMHENPRGKALIIGVEFKNGGDQRREGVVVDCDNLRQLLEGLHMNVTVCRDDKVTLKAEEIKEKVKEFAEPENHEDSQCCVLALLSHGTGDDMHGDQIAGADGNLVNLSTLLGYFEKTLENKPKIFIIQACRGGKTGEVAPTAPFRERKDTFICYATQERHVAYFNPDPKKGSYFITALVATFQERAQDLDIVQLMNQVINTVKACPIWAEEKDEHTKKERQFPAQQIPDFEDKLDCNKKLYFFPGVCFWK